MTVIFLFFTLLLSSCTHWSQKTNTTTDIKNPSESREKSSKDSPSNSENNEGMTAQNLGPHKDLESFHLNEDAAVNAQKNSLVSQELNEIPTEVNPLVDRWVSYFQNKGHAHMERYLARSTRYEKIMKKVLHDNGLPDDLFYIALIESGFSSRAMSHAAAVGYWQFIRGTGRRYGLEINKFVDERRDPVVATQAAADYFKELYSMFGSWYLAMASYNVGEGKVKRESLRNDTRDFWEIAKKRKLPKETVNYIPKFIAAKLIAKNPDKYGFEGIDYLPPIEFDSLKFDYPINLRLMAEKMNYNYEDFKALNPKFKGEIAPVSNNSLDLRIPVGFKEQALLAASESKVEKVEFIADSGETELYKIRRGESLYTIARKFRTTVAYLRDLNDLPRRKKLRAGARILVPDRTPLREKRSKSLVAVVNTLNSSETNALNKSSVLAMTAQSGSEDSTTSSHHFYIVQNGDSLFSIAQKYNTTVKQLKKINQIRRGRVLKVGIKLKLPIQNESDKNSPKSQESGNKNSMDSTQKKMSSRKYHIVKRGENLKKVSELYNVNFSRLKSKNNIKNTSRIYEGSRLIIPQ